MQILLDECLPRPLIRLIAGHDAKTVPEMGWAGKSNGELPALMAGLFDVFLTVDRNLVFSQNLSGLKIGVVVLHASSNRLEDLQPLVPQVLQALRSLRIGQIIHLSVWWRVPNPRSIPLGAGLRIDRGYPQENGDSG